MGESELTGEICWLIMLNSEYIAIPMCLLCDFSLSTQLLECRLRKGGEGSFRLVFCHLGGKNDSGKGS